MAHVLVVDDDAPTRNVIRLILEEDAHYVIEASNGHHALAAMRASRRPLVVLLDLLMPGMSGIAVLREVAADETLRGRHAVIIVTSSPPARDSPASAVFAHLGASVLAKPFDIGGLLAAVDEAAQRLDGMRRRVAEVG